MTGSRISTTVTTTVILGTNYPSPLTITATGVVDVTQTYGAPGITGAQSGDEVINRGSVTAAVGSNYTKADSAGTGGVGIDLTAAGTIVSIGMIEGGAGGYAGKNGYGGTGGNAIDIAGGKISNSGTIEGGSAGGQSGYNLVNVQNGGIGVDVTGAGLALGNSGLIIGGFSYADNGGVGVDFAAAGTLRNTGTISGGLTEGGVSGAGVSLASGCLLVNGGEITGGFAGIGLVAAGSTLRNNGTIIGGEGITGSVGRRYVDSAGGVGVSLTGGILTNDGEINGGAGTYPFEVYGASPGGAGVIDTDGILLNNGTIDGGPSQTNVGGNYGVQLGSGASLTNHGTIMGGVGENNASGYGVSYGGGGLTVAAHAVAANAGLIQGGSANYSGGLGGAGAIIASGGTLTNTGRLAGGAGGAPSNYGTGMGGSGAEIEGGTLIVSGTVLGGTDMQGGTQGDAVAFIGSAGGTLVITASAVFDGDIAGNAAAPDTLVLSGSVAGTLSGFGTTVTGLTTINEDAHAQWTLEGAVAGKGALNLGTGATLILDGGTVSIASIVFGAAGGDTLHFGAPTGVSSTLSGFGTGDRITLANIKASALSYANGTLTLFGANNAVVDTLKFAGNYTAADFALQREGPTTEVLYAGSNALSLAPEFIPLTNLDAPLSHVVTDAVHMAMPRQDGLPFLVAWLHR